MGHIYAVLECQNEGSLTIRGSLSLFQELLAALLKQQDEACKPADTQNNAPTTPERNEIKP